MLVRIVTVDEGHHAWQICGAELPIHVGRHPEVSVRLDDPAVSDVHCRIDEFHGLLWVCDVGSAQGTFVNGILVSESPLFSGDSLTVGRTTLRIHYQQQLAPRLILA